MYKSKLLSALTLFMYSNSFAQQATEDYELYAVNDTVKNKKGETLIVLSETAMQALRPDQLHQLRGFGKLVPVAVPVIEQVEGGSVRCMMAEIFLQRKS